MSSTLVEAEHQRSWPSFFAWSLVGAAFVVGLLSILTMGAPILLVAVIAAVALGLSRRARTGVLGLVFGSALPLLYVAYLNRSGPAGCAPRSPMRLRASSSGARGGGSQPPPCYS